MTNALAMASVQRNVVVRMKSGRGTEDETHAADIMNHWRLARLVHFAPQPPHVNVNEVGLGNEVVVPHLLQQHRARQHLLLATHHVFEQAEFARQQINRAIPALGGALDEIKLEWAYPEHRIAASWPEECGRAGALRPRAHRKDHVRYC